MDIRAVTRASLVMVCVLLGAGAWADEADTARITVLSSRPSLVSGGNALVAVQGDGSVTLNGADVTAVFKPAKGGERVGLVDGLKLGANVLKMGEASLTLTNHSISGPMFSGPHEMPFYCMTDEFALPASKETLGAPLDSDCSVKTRVDFVYRTKAGQFKPLPAGAKPDDLAETNTSDGKTVPYIVRVETGTINRAIYQTAILADPAIAVGPTTPPPAWNKRLVYTFGAGCPGGWYIQGSKLGNRGILEDMILRHGYAMASSTLNVNGNNCNIVLSAETAAMVKEQFIKSYGVPQFTIGMGCSGGADTLQPVADAYPGLVDGIIVGCSFPEMIGASIMSVADSDLMAHYFKQAKLNWSDKEKIAASGFPTISAIDTVAKSAIRIKPDSKNCNAVIPANTRFDRTGNPTGLRCDFYDHMVNVLGRDPKTGAVRQTMDNEGVQYGLAALKSGAISTQQFLDLNRAIGGFDKDGDYSALRSEADAEALSIAYETGQMTNGGLGLKSTPIIDYRGYVDQPKNRLELHQRFHSFSMRARLEQVNGSAVNQIMLVESGLPPRGHFSDQSPVLSHAVLQMDEWLTRLNTGNGTRPSLAAIAKAKPADLTDACFTDNGTVKIAETQVYRGDTKCNKLYPSHSGPRLVAGEPLVENVLKCQFKPINIADYDGKLGKDDLAELKTIFPKGVCDYSKPGVGQVPTKGTWQSF